MKRRILNSIVFILLTTLAFGKTNSEFDKSSYYSAISSESLRKVNEQISVLKESSVKEKNGFIGALLMKKAGLVANLGEKLSLFKQGHKYLEEAIGDFPQNTELRFLRLIIQENAPRILNYDDDLEGDSIYIKRTFNNLPEVVKKAIMDYSKKSMVLASL